MIVLAEHAHAKYNKAHYYNEAQKLENAANQFIQFFELGGVMDRLPADMPKRLVMCQLKEILGGD